jgi:hypothetical protein
MGIHFSNLDDKKRKEFLVLIFCLVIGFALRFYAFDQKSLWIDEIHTFNDSRDDLKGHIKFYKERPSHLHPPLFFILTHFFYPFTKPERDLRIIPLIFGILSIPMMYFLSKSFSPHIALPCTLSLTFMVYHISLSQDGRFYSMLMFLGMVSLYFFVQHLKTSKKIFLVPVALISSLLFYTGYSSVLFIALFQILWLYEFNKNVGKTRFSSFFILNSLILLVCIPWILFIALNYGGQSVMPSSHTEGTGSFLSIVHWILNDWAPHAPLMMTSALLLILFPFFSKSRKNALILLSLFFLPVSGLFLFCKLFQITHFVSSRYFINFLPLFFITIYLSLHAIEVKFHHSKKIMRLTPLFITLLIISNITLLPLYYRSEKQDFRRLVVFLNEYLRDGDKIIVANSSDIVGILHYFKAYPKGRFYFLPTRRVSETEIETKISLNSQNREFVISHSKTYWNQYLVEENRVWLVVGKIDAKKFRMNRGFVLKGYFDGSFLNCTRFPDDASMYLFLWDPKSPEEKGIDMPIE